MADLQKLRMARSVDADVKTLYSGLPCSVALRSMYA
jgi:hypothetical protein